MSGRAAALAAIAALCACKESPPRDEPPPRPAVEPGEAAAPEEPADACKPAIEPLAVDDAVCAAYVEQLRGLGEDAAPGGVAAHLEQFPRTPGWARRLLEQCEIDGLATVGPILLEAAGGCAGAVDVLEQMAQAGSVTPDVVGAATAEALAACDCSLAATDGFVSLLVYVMQPRKPADDGGP